MLTKGGCRDSPQRSLITSKKLSSESSILWRRSLWCQITQKNLKQTGARNLDRVTGRWTHGDIFRVPQGEIFQTLRTKMEAKSQTVLDFQVADSETLCRNEGSSVESL